MKKMYWHAHILPRFFIVTLCLTALVGMYLVERFKTFVPQNYYTEKVAAAELAKQAFAVIKQRRHYLGIPITLTDDPQQSGLIGYRLTNMTTDQGVLSAKQTTINPNIAALFVDWLKQLDLKQGDVVAVAATGSFPALNIAMLAAIKTLGLKPLIIYSMGSSQYGANILGFTWLDMNQELVRQHVFDYEPIAVSLGGVHDQALGVNDNVRAALKRTALQYHFNFIEPKDTVDSISQRMELYKKNANDQSIKAYINIGGGVASIGLKHLSVQEKIIKIHKRVEYHSLPVGVVMSLPIDLANTDSEAVRFLKKGAPIINVRNVSQQLRVKYSLPRSPKFSPVIGWGALFFHEEYNITVTVVVLVALIFFLTILAILSRRYLIRYVRPRR